MYLVVVFLPLIIFQEINALALQYVDGSHFYCSILNLFYILKKGGGNLFALDADFCLKMKFFIIQSFSLMFTPQDRLVMDALNGQFDNELNYLKTVVNLLSDHKWIYMFANTRLLVDNVLDEIPVEWTSHLGFTNVQDVDNAMKGIIQVCIFE